MREEEGGFVKEERGFVRGEGWFRGGPLKGLSKGGLGREF